MQRIMFNDKYGLTNAVLRRTKNVTRRIAYDKELKHELHTGWDDSKHLILCDGWMQIAKSKYAVGEELAIAQSYRSLLGTECLSADKEDTVCKLIRGRHAGSTNKMFVKTSLMPNHIRITAITLERLQDISDEDCARECVFFYNFYDKAYEVCGLRPQFKTRKDGFAALIDKISGKGTWKRNPYVFVYSFELI